MKDRRNRARRIDNQHHFNNGHDFDHYQHYDNLPFNQLHKKPLYNDLENSDSYYKTATRQLKTDDNNNYQWL